MTWNGNEAHAALEKRAVVLSDDIAFAREVSGHSIPYWSAAWPRINEVHRKGLVRVTVLSRWMAEVEACGEAGNAPAPRVGMETPDALA